LHQLKLLIDISSIIPAAALKLGQSWSIAASIIVETRSRTFPEIESHLLAWIKRYNL
jgi:hypothetical protein